MRSMLLQARVRGTLGTALATVVGTAGAQNEPPRQAASAAVARAAESLPDVPAVLQMLSSSAWHFAITVVILAALIALLLEATNDFGQRAQRSREVLRGALKVPAHVLGDIGIDDTLLDLPPDELAAQLASIANMPGDKRSASHVPPEQRTLRTLLLEGMPDNDPPMIWEQRQQAEALYVDRQLDRLQVHLRANYRSLERRLALAMGVFVVALVLLSVKVASIQLAVAFGVIVVFVPFSWMTSARSPSDA